MDLAQISERKSPMCSSGERKGMTFPPGKCIGTDILFVHTSRHLGTNSKQYLKALLWKGYINIEKYNLSTLRIGAKFNTQTIYLIAKSFLVNFVQSLGHLGKAAAMKGTSSLEADTPTHERKH